MTHRAVAICAFVLLNGIAHAQNGTIGQQIEESVDGLSTATGEEFISEIETVLYEWSELGGSTSDYFDASQSVIANIDRYMAETGSAQEDLPAPLAALQMIALNYTGGTTGTGLEFSPEAALAVYETGLVTMRQGPPMSYRGEYQSIMKRIWVETWGRSNLDGMMGEDAPGDYAKMLFDVHDAPTLCAPGEAVFWSCADPRKDRLLSVCGSPTSDRETSWVQYRIGKPGDLELSYPETQSPNFASDEAMMAGEGNFSLDVWRYGGSTLEFSNGAYDYAIEDESFKDNAIVTARRGADTVFELSCKTTHPFMKTIEGHLWGTANDDRLNIIPGKMLETPPTACLADTETVWSCLDEDEGGVMSVCLAGEGNARTIQSRMTYQDGSDRTIPDAPVALDDERIDIFANVPGHNVLSMTLGNEEYFFSSSPEPTDGGVDYWRGGTPRMQTDCTVQIDRLPELMGQNDETGEAGAFTYTPQRISYGTMKPSPDEFDSLILRLQGLEAAGEFEAGAGMEPLHVLGGLSAKSFALSVRADDFDCRSDHGGMCVGPEEIYPLLAFLIGFNGEGGFDWFAPRDIQSADDIDLEEVALSFQTFSPPGTPVVDDDQSDSGFCQARAYFDDWESGIEMYQSVADQLKLEENEDYEWLWESFRGVAGRYNVRAEPKISSAIVGKVANEAIHFTNLSSVIEADGYGWREVRLPDGMTGYMAASENELLKLDDGGQVCARFEDGDIRLTSISLGGE